MPLLKRLISKKRSILLFVIILITNGNAAFAQTGIYDTIKTTAIIYNGDTIESKTLSTVEMYARYSGGNMSNYAKWTRLRNAIYVTYPYAMRAGLVMNDINSKLATVTDRSERRKYTSRRPRKSRLRKKLRKWAQSRQTAKKPLAR